MKLKLNASNHIHNYHLRNYVKHIDSTYFDNEFLMDLLRMTNGDAIGYIDEIYHTDELKILSLEYSRGTALKYFKNPSHEQRLKALSYHWDIFSLLKNPTDKEIKLYNQLREKEREKEYIPGITLARFIVPFRFD